MSDLKINNITDRTGDSGPVIAGVSTVSSTGAFTVPVGPTEYRGGRGRAVFAGGYSASPVNYTGTMDYVEIATTGNAADFGDLSVKRYNVSGCASATRGVLLAGQGTPSALFNTIDYVTISSGGGASDFGDLIDLGGTINDLMQSGAVTSNNTRGLYMGGFTPVGGLGGRQNIIEFVTIASTGDASDFGDITVYSQASQACASPTRAVRGAGAGNPANQQVMDYVTIATRGDAIHFGELASILGLFPASLSSTTRGIFAGGLNPSNLNNIEYVTIATLGNATDFGDLTAARYGAAGSSNQTRGLFGGGGTPTYVNTIDYITIASTGNATDYGDLSEVRATVAGLSDAHGGLG